MGESISLTELMYYINGFRLGLGKYLRNPSNQLDVLSDLATLEELASKNIYVIRADGIYSNFNKMGILFVGPSESGKSSICEILEQETDSAYFIGGEEAYLEEGLLLTEPAFKLFPIRPTLHNGLLFEEGYPVDNMIYVEKKDHSSSSIGNLKDINRMYAYLLQVIFNENDNLDSDELGANTSYIARLLEQTPPDTNCYHLFNATGHLDQSTRLIKTLFF